MGKTKQLALPPVVHDSLTLLLARVAKTTRARTERELEMLGLELRHVHVLLAITHNGASSQRQLGELLGIDRTTMVTLVDQLEERGLITRKKNPDDRRAWDVDVTDRGQSTSEWASKMLASSEANALSALTEHQQETLRKLLLKASSRT